MESKTLLLGGFGLLILLVAWFPVFVRKFPLTLPVLCVAIGFCGFSLLGEKGLSPRDYPAVMEFMIELTIVVSLTGAGLRIDRPLVPRRWADTGRLLGIVLPLSIAGITALAALCLGMPWETSLLIGAALAPTDPVLAANVQVGPPQEGPEDEVRFSLTSEAGLNDGLGFPFTLLAIGLASHGGSIGTWAWEWVAIDLLWGGIAGIATGWLVGKLLGTIVQEAGKRLGNTPGQGFAALGITLATYAGAQLLNANGFIAVFVAALVMRRQDRHPEYNFRLYDFTEEAERLLTMILLVLFGASLTGGLLKGLTWEIAAVAVATLFVIRPLAGIVGLQGSPMLQSERKMVSFFGIRGIGSFYYIVYASGMADFSQLDTAWTLVAFVVLLSVFCFGLSASPLMRWMDNRRTYEARYR